MSRVVITGIGVVSPIGNSLGEVWSRAQAGISGIAPITQFDTEGFPWKVAGTVKGFSAENYLSPKEIFRLDPFARYAVAAAIEAAADAALVTFDTDRGLENPRGKVWKVSEILRNAGVIIGSSRGGISTIEKEIQRRCIHAGDRSPRKVSAYLMASTTISMAASYVAQCLGIAGYCLGISNACASGAIAIGEAYRLIKSGYRFPILCGGSEAPLCRICVEGYGTARALSRRADSSASRPFDATRDGFVLAEGACILVLEPYESALRRGVRMYGEIVGYGNTTDAFHQTVPSAEGEASAMRIALEHASLQPDDVDLISAHGTSTLIGDRTETEAIKKVFGKSADRIPVFALKSVTGHMLAASGALEAALTALSLKEGIVVPTAHLRNRDPACDLALATECREADMEYALSQSFGFGGLNAVLIFRRVRA